MIDQATTLRRLTAQSSSATSSSTEAVHLPALPDESLPSSSSSTADDKQASKSTPAFSVAIASGKGGVGKSNFAVNVALELAVLKRRVTLLDADLALANADVLLGLNPRFHLGHVLRGERTLDEVVITTAQNFRLIPGGSGVEELAHLTDAQHQRLVAELQAMEANSDFLLIDAAAGIAGNVTGIVRAANTVVIVTTPDPTALVDAYALIKVIHRHAADKAIYVVVNNTVGLSDAEETFAQLRTAANSFLKHELFFLGMIPRDAQLAQAVREQSPIVEFAPDAPSSRALRLIAKQIIKLQRQESLASRTPQSFWSQLVDAKI